MSRAQTYLETLRRVPSDIILSVGCRKILPVEPGACICGWVLREHIARMIDQAADDIDVHGPNAQRIAQGVGTTGRCAVVFGGTEHEWDRIFDGIISDAENVEMAFVERVLECVP